MPVCSVEERSLSSLCVAPTWLSDEEDNELIRVVHGEQSPRDATEQENQIRGRTRVSITVIFEKMCRQC